MEEFLDAEGDYQILTRPSEVLVPDRDAQIQSAQSDLEAAEQLRARYLDTPQQPEGLEAKPQ